MVSLMKKVRDCRKYLTIVANFYYLKDFLCSVCYTVYSPNNYMMSACEIKGQLFMAYAVHENPKIRKT